MTELDRRAELYVDTAILAGEILLNSGAEIFRVEDTVKRILEHSELGRVEVFALTTGIFISLESDEREPVTLVRRINNHSSNLNRVFRVNNVSRRLCSGRMPVEDAYKELNEIKQEKLYTVVQQAFAYAMVCSFFSIMFGGGLYDFLVSACIGVLLGFLFYGLNKYNINDFCQNALSAFLVGAISLLAGKAGGIRVDHNIITISSIMPMVPGVSFTTSIRDMLNGDYSSGLSRMAEALVVGLALAFGVGIAITVLGKAGGLL